MALHPKYMTKGHSFQGAQHFGHTKIAPYDQADHSTHHADSRWWKSRARLESEKDHKKMHNREWNAKQDLKDAKNAEEAAKQAAEIAQQALAVEQKAYVLTENRRGEIGITQEDLDRVISYANDRDALAQEVQDLADAASEASGQGYTEPQDAPIWPYILGGAAVIGIGIFILQRRR